MPMSLSPSMLAFAVLASVRTVTSLFSPYNSTDPPPPLSMVHHGRTRQRLILSDHAKCSAQLGSHTNQVVARGLVCPLTGDMVHIIVRLWYCQQTNHAAWFSSWAHFCVAVGRPRTKVKVKSRKINDLLRYDLVTTSF